MQGSTGTCGLTGEKWRAQGDNFRAFLGDLVAALPQIDLSGELSP